MSNELVTAAQTLIRKPSVTPDDLGCQQWLREQLDSLGFQCESMKFGDVDNLWAVYGDSGPLFCFAGHTDVVPPGPESDWLHPPFAAVVENNRLYGRGAADMKGSIAAMLVAVTDFINARPVQRGRLAFLITSDEEGIAADGTLKVIEALSQRGTRIDHCLVGEPSSSDMTGDVVRIGRRGSLNLTLNVNGLQGHVAYPEKAANPIHLAAPALAELAAEHWDDGNEHFPPSTFQISNLNSGTGANNVIPGALTAECNFRFSTASTAEQLQNRTERILKEHQLDFTAKWHLSGAPFLSPAGLLTESVQQAIESTTGKRPLLSTGGGTSDGRFIAPTGAEVLELGPCNGTIHQVNEFVDLDDLQTLSRQYYLILSDLFDKFES